MEKIPTPEIFMYTQRMWKTYRSFSHLQQRNLLHSSTFNNERYKTLKLHKVVYYKFLRSFVYDKIC